jgi:hypothetical protein
MSKEHDIDANDNGDQHRNVKRDNHVLGHVNHRLAQGATARPGAQQKGKPSAPTRELARDIRERTNGLLSFFTKFREFRIADKTVAFPCDQLRNGCTASEVIEHECDCAIFCIQELPKGQVSRMTSFRPVRDDTLRLYQNALAGHIEEMVFQRSEFFPVTLGNSIHDTFPHGVPGANGIVSRASNPGHFLSPRSAKLAADTALRPGFSQDGLDPTVVSPAAISAVGIRLGRSFRPVVLSDRVSRTGFTRAKAQFPSRCRRCRETTDFRQAAPMQARG